MNMITVFASFISIIAAWALTRLTDHFTDNKQARKKHHKLLFNLLELQSRINRILELEPSMEQIIPEIEKALSEEVNQPVSLGGVKPLYLEELKGQFEKQLILPDLSDEIDAILRDLAEIDPILSFRLLGSFQLAEKMRMIREVMEKMRLNYQLPEVIWEDIFLKPVIKDISNDLEQTIDEIAKKCGRKIRKQLLGLRKTNKALDSIRIKEFMNQLIDGAKKLENNTKD